MDTCLEFDNQFSYQHQPAALFRETGASYLSQITVFMFLQFMSAATSLAVGVAIVRGLASHSTATIGNFYADFVRFCTRIPISFMYNSSNNFYFLRNANDI